MVAAPSVVGRRFGGGVVAGGKVGGGSVASDILEVKELLAGRSGLVKPTAGVAQAGIFPSGQFVASLLSWNILRSAMFSRLRYAFCACKSSKSCWHLRKRSSIAIDRVSASFAAACGSRCESSSFNCIGAARIAAAPAHVAYPPRRLSQGSSAQCDSYEAVRETALMQQPSVRPLVPENMDATLSVRDPVRAMTSSGRVSMAAT